MSEKTIKKIPNVPNLRFSTFADVWKRNKLSDIALIVDGTHQTPEYQKNGIKFASVENINNPYSSDKFIAEEDYFKNYKIKPKINDILMTRITAGIIGETYVIDRDEPLGYYVSLALIRPQKEYNSRFLSENFHTYRFRKELDSRIIKVAFPQKINLNDIGECSIFTCSLAEQNKIASFFKIIDDLIETQIKIINKLESLICSLRNEFFCKYDWEWKRLDSFINNGTITLKRGNVIPKHEKTEEYKFPVYSSSIHNNGLMGFNNSYMFDKELITWSVDGGGNFFYRSKHKFNVTNVCGIMEVKDNIFNYRFLSEILSAQHSKMIFDYQTKAHPSVIEKLYKLPIVDIKIQENIALIFELYYQKLEKEKDILSLYKKQKAYLLQNMFI